MTMLAGKSGTHYRCMTRKPLSRAGRMLNEGCLGKVEHQVELDQGTCKSAKFITPTSVEEFDRARAMTPNSVRSLQRMIGDDRSGSQLLAEYAQDMQMTLRKLKQTDLGRLKMNALAAAIRRQATPMVNFINEQARALQAMHDAMKPPEPEPVPAAQSGNVRFDIIDDRNTSAQASISYSTEAVESPEELVGTPEELVASPEELVGTPSENQVEILVGSDEIVASPSDTVGTRSDGFSYHYSSELTPDPGCEGQNFTEESTLFREDTPPECEHWTESFSFVDPLGREESHLSQVDTVDKSTLTRDVSTGFGWLDKDAPIDSSILETDTLWQNSLEAL